MRNEFDLISGVAKPQNENEDKTFVSTNISPYNKKKKPKTGLKSKATNQLMKKMKLIANIKIQEGLLGLKQVDKFVNFVEKLTKS